MHADWSPVAQRNVLQAVTPSIAIPSLSSRMHKVSILDNAAVVRDGLTDEQGETYYDDQCRWKKDQNLIQIEG